MDSFLVKFQLNAFLMLDFFIDEKDLSGERSMRSLISGVVHTQTTASKRRIQQSVSFLLN
jgi:hypothetical protein